MVLRQNFGPERGDGYSPLPQAGLLKLQCAHNHPGVLFQRRILTQNFWGGPRLPSLLEVSTQRIARPEQITESQGGDLFPGSATINQRHNEVQVFPGGSDSEESTCNAGDRGSIPGSGRSSGEGNGNPLQYPCLENPMDRGA